MYSIIFLDIYSHIDRVFCRFEKHYPISRGNKVIGTWTVHRVLYIVPSVWTCKVTRCRNGIPIHKVREREREKRRRVDRSETPSLADRRAITLEMQRKEEGASLLTLALTEKLHRVTSYYADGKRYFKVSRQQNAKRAWGLAVAENAT